MPELPEVETTRRGLAPHLVGRRLEAVQVREPRLRWPVAADFSQRLTGATLTDLRRRAKYLLFDFQRPAGGGTLIAHLGMSGSMRLVAADAPLLPHDHVQFVFAGPAELRLNDPRRFGSLHFVDGAAEGHFLLGHLGPEPLDPGFDGEYLFQRARKRRAPVKAFIMDARIVVGVGNIYATEALFRAGIRPSRPAGRISAARYGLLADAIRAVLEEALIMGGTTLRDFVGSDGRPGYFRQSLAVYGRGGAPCRVCGGVLRGDRIGQRATVFCPACQR